MRRVIIFSLLTAFSVFPLFGRETPNPVYTLKVFFDTVQSVKSIKRYDNQTAVFLQRLSSSLREKLLQFFTSRAIYLYLKDGLGSDYTLFYTFPRAYIKAISLKEETDNGFKYSFGYKISIDLALYIFKTSSNPQLVCYKVFSFNRYYPPSSQYLPLYTSLADSVAETFYLQMEPLLKDFLKRERQKMEYYRNLGK